MRRWRIQNQVLLLVAFLIAVMLGLLVFHTIERVRTLRHEQRTYMQALADVTAARLDQLAIDSRDLLAVLSNLPLLRRIDGMACETTAGHIDFDANLYADVVVFDLRGQLVCSATGFSLQGSPDVAGQAWFQAALSRPGFQISEPFLDPASNTRVVMVSHPIRASGGEHIGVLGFPVELQQLGQQLVPAGWPDGRALKILNGSGRVIARVPQVQDRVVEDAIDEAFLSPDRPAEPDMLEERGLDGVRRFYSHQSAPAAGWHVVVGVPVDHIYTPARQLLLKSLWVILAATLVAVAFAIAATRRILGPLRRLVSGVGRDYGQEALLEAIAEGSPEIRRLGAELVDALEFRLAAQQRELVLAKVLESANEVIFMTDKDNRITAINHAFETITGYTEAEALGRDPGMLGSDRHDRDFFRAFWHELQTTGSWQGEIWNRRKSGEVFPAIQAVSRVRNEAGEVCHVAVMLDISRQKEAEHKLEHLARHDPLTGLPNRDVLLARLEMAVARNRRVKNQHLAVVSVDVDGFRHVNDTLGHSAGDELLVQVARRLELCFGAGATVCRIGGGAFMAIVECLPHKDAVVPIIVRIQRAMEPAFQIGERSISASLSVGISLHPDHADDAVELVSFADAATHHGKRHGRGRFAFYTEDLTLEAERRLGLEHDLRHALAHPDEFFLVFQPQVSLHDGRIVGCEALLRWNHPEQGLLLPDEFIPVAEDSGLIEPITQWVVEEACRRLRQWQERLGHVPMVAINLSGKHLGSGRFVDFLRDALHRHGVAPDRIDLEITESALILEAEAAQREISLLRELGCGVSIDDFGTGYSSLSYLKKFDAQIVKIDRSFISQVDRDASNQGIARAVIAVGHALRMKVLAEGVEKPAERQWLQEAGCDLMQGFIFCRPLPAGQYVEFVAARSVGD